MYIKTFAIMIVSIALISTAVMAECACSKNRKQNPLTQINTEPSIEETLGFKPPA